jgi:hypothetical protein
MAPYPANSDDPVPSGDDPRFDGESEVEFTDEEHPHPHSGDSPPPATRRGRRFAIAVALLFIAVIVTFLIWFIAENRERTMDGAGMLGNAGRSPPAYSQSPLPAARSGRAFSG